MKEMYNNYEEEDDDWDLPEVNMLSIIDVKFIHFIDYLFWRILHQFIFFYPTGKRSLSRRSQSRNYDRNGSSISSTYSLYGKLSREIRKFEEILTMKNMEKILSNPKFCFRLK